LLRTHQQDHGGILVVSILRPRGFLSLPRLLKVIAIFAIAVQANPIDVFAQKKVLIIAVEDDAAPWSRADGSGYANDVVTAAFRAVGVDVGLRAMPYARCKRMTMNGQVVGCFSMSPAREFEGTIEFSAQPLFTCYAGYFYKLDRPPRVGRQDDLPAQTTVGTVIGYEYPASFERLKEKGGLMIEESSSEEINLKKLALGRIDLALLTYNEIKSPEWLMIKAGVKGKVKPTFRAGTLNSYIGFSLKHPEGAKALEQFNKGFRLITTNGVLARLKRNWLQKLAQESSSN
jgi:polar amino acid transport system substrate-binding protein